MKCALRITFLLGLMSIRTPCYAGPPFNVDDPGTAEYHRFNVNFAFASSQNASGELQSFPNLSVGYGYSKTLELGIGMAGIGIRSAGGAHISGLGDINVSFKWRFLNEQRYLPQLALGYQIKSPTADANRGLGSGATDHALWVSGAKSFGRWVGFANVGYNFLAGNSGASNLYWGAGLTYQLTETLIVGGNVYGNSANVVGDRSELAWGLGMSYNFAPDRSFMFSIGKSDHGFSDLNVYAGFGFTFGK